MGAAIPACVCEAPLHPQRTPTAEAAGRIARRRRDFVLNEVPSLHQVLRLTGKRPLPRQFRCARALPQRRRQSSWSFPATLRRWQRDGLIPQYEGDGWNGSAIGHARAVARMRERGHSLEEIRKATEEGRLAYAYADELFPDSDKQYTLTQAARESGLEQALIERIVTALGFPAQTESLSEEDLQLLRYATAALDAGFPLVALLQLVRVYGQAIAQIADAEVRLFHLYVHEPLMRSGASGVEVAEEMRASRGPAAALLAGGGPDPPALPAALHRTGRGRPYGIGPGR